MKAIVEFLNRLSILKMDGNERSSRLACILLLGVVAVLCWWMAMKVDKKLAFIIDSVDLPQRSKITIGKGSDICYYDVPQDYLIVNYEDGQFTWRVNEQYHDTLQYFKVNDRNPNTHLIRDDESQLITLRLPDSDRDTLQLQLTGAEVWKTWKQFRRQKDVTVRHFATFHQLHSKEVDDSTRQRYLAQMQQTEVRSFFEKNGNTLKLVILDEWTSVTEDGKTTSYERSGTVAREEGRQGFKVQFFRLNEYCYMDEHPERGYFHIDGVNYVMKATVKLTEWGAGHIMLTPTGQQIGIHFPHPITFVGSVDSLRRKSEASSQVITLKQDNHSYPSKSDLFLPAFSSAINYDLCNIEFFHGKDSIVVSDNHRNLHCVQNTTTGVLPFSVIPAFTKVDLHSGHDTLHCRIGYINGAFICSYLWLPLAVCLLIILMIWLPFSPVRLTKRQSTVLYGSQRLERYPRYLTILTLLAMAYCVCKSLIVLKLSYSYPYFEELTGIIPFSTSCMLLLFFSLAMLLNAPLRRMVSEKKKPLIRFSTWMVCSGIFACLAYLFFHYADSQINQGVIDSYFRDEVFDFNPFGWIDKYGINDTHRSVVYALFIVEAGVLVLWLLTDLFLTPLMKAIEYVSAWWQRKVSEPFSDLVAHYWNKISTFRKLEKLKAKKSDNKRLNLLIARFGHLPLMTAVFLCSLIFTMVFGISSVLWIITVVLMLLVFAFDTIHDGLLGALRVMCPTHFIILGLLAVIGNYSGRFGTAFVTLFVVLGLTEALTCESIQKDGKSRHVLFSQMIFIIIFYIIGAMAGDNGYMTNFMGFAMCMVCFYFLMERPVTYQNKVYQEAKRESRWVNFMLVVLAVLLVAMPFICSRLFSPEKVNYSRIARRVMLYSNFSDLERSGYRYSESDAEFMVIMSHYMQKSEGHDPLSNDAHFLHPSVSSGQSPVVINDLSMPLAFFGSYGHLLTTTVFFLLLALLMWLVMSYSLHHEDPYHPCLTKAMQWRMLAMFMWLGTSFYIYLSYIDRLPFTGRLIPGYGVDAVGEALETALLLAFMAAVSCRKKTISFKTS